MDYSLNRITDAKDESLTLADAKLHLRVDGTEEDATITALITAARAAVENEIGRPIGEQTFELGLRCWPMLIKFPQPPLTDVLSIKYTVYEGETRTLFDKTASPAIGGTPIFKIDTSGDPGELWLRPTEVWPSDILESGFPIRIRFTAGITDFPLPLKQAMLMLIGQWYENREAVVMESRLVPTEMPLAVKWLCQPYAHEEFR